MTDKIFRLIFSGGQNCGRFLVLWGLVLMCNVVFITVGTTNAKCVLKMVEFTVTEHETVSRSLLFVTKVLTFHFSAVSMYVLQ